MAPEAALPPEFAALLERASRSHRAGEAVDAEQRYREIVDAFPLAAEPRRRLGILYAQTGRPAQGIELIGAAAGLAPCAEYFQDLGQACLVAQRNDDAVAAFRRALDLDPAAVAPRIALGSILPQMQANDEAIRLLQEAIRLAPHLFEAHFNLGVALAAQGRPDAAIAAYRNALTVDPNAVAALANLGILLKEQKQLDEAIAYDRRAIAVAPDLAQLHLNLAVALHEAGQLRPALDAIVRATELAPRDVQAVLLRQHIEQKLENFPAAEASLRHLVGLNPQHTVALALWSVVLQQVGKAEEAKGLLDFPARLQRRRLDHVDGWPSLEAFNAALVEEIFHHPTLTYEPPSKSTLRGSQTQEIFDRTAGPFAALRGIVEREITAYMATGLPGPRPQRWHLQGWAVVLNSSGHQLPHIHALSAVSGVYYVRIPEAVRTGGDGEAGCIRFGDPGGSLPHGRAVGGLQTASLKPEEGLMILFPAYYWHCTVPFESDQDRICIAFDAVPDP